MVNESMMRKDFGPTNYTNFFKYYDSFFFIWKLPSDEGIRSDRVNHKGIRRVLTRHGQRWEKSADDIRSRFSRRLRTVPTSPFKGRVRPDVNFLRSGFIGRPWRELSNQLEASVWWPADDDDPGLPTIILECRRSEAGSQDVSGRT